MTVEPIFPNYGQAQTLVTGAASAAITGLPDQQFQVVVTALTTNCYVRFTKGDDTSAATTADFLLIANQPRVLSKGDATRCAAISPGGAGSLHIMPCLGSGSV